MNSRISWLDQVKGLGIIIGLISYFSPLLIADFNPQSSQVNINNINFIKNIELFTQMGLILISALSFRFVENKDLQWFGKKFLILVLLSTFLYAVGQDYRSIFWQPLQCLWFYFPLFYIINQQSSLGFKSLLWFLILIIYYISLPLWESLGSSLLGSIFFGYKQHQVSFNVFMGFPMVVLSSILSEFLIKDKKIKTNLLIKTIFTLLAIIVIKSLTTYYLIISENTYGYPPNINEFLSGAVIVLIGILLSIKFPIKQLSNFGRFGLKHYWSLWLFGSLIFEWNRVGMYQFNIFSALVLIITILSVFIGIKR